MTVQAPGAPAASLTGDRRAVGGALAELADELEVLVARAQAVQRAAERSAFHALPLQLDVVAAEWARLAGRLRERAAALGVRPLPPRRRAEPRRDAPGVRRALAALTERLAAVMAHADEALASAAVRDGVSERLLADVLDALDGHDWTLRAQR